MGYDNWVNGEAIIEPPIDEKDWPEPDAGYGGEDLYFEVFTLENVPGDQTVTVVNGVITVVGDNAGYTKVGWYTDDSSRGDFDANFLALFQWVQKHGSKINGKFHRSGEESGDFQRWRFEGDQMYDEYPQIAWPNGDIGEGA